MNGIICEILQISIFANGQGIITFWNWESRQFSDQVYFFFKKEILLKAYFVEIYCHDGRTWSITFYFHEFCD